MGLFAITPRGGCEGLEREIAKICRKVVKENVVSSQGSDGKISLEALEVYSGVRKYDYGKAEEQNVVGQVNGLAWTSVGGELLTIESSAVEGKGKTIKTGSLGDVMQESIQAAFTVVRSRAKSLELDANFHEKFDLHIHVRKGRPQRTDPVQELACVPLLSVLTDIPVKSDVAMTGEITLRGQVLKNRWSQREIARRTSW